MDDKENSRTRKRLATRQSISDAATRLFMERGFDAVTIDAVRILAHDLATRDHEFMLLPDDTRRFIKTAMDSEALKARAREMRDDFTRALAIVLAETSNQPTDDPNAHLAAGLIVSVWTIAFAEAQKLFDRTKNASEAKRCFITVIDRGITGTEAALAETA